MCTAISINPSNRRSGNNDRHNYNDHGYHNDRDERQEFQEFKELQKPQGNRARDEHKCKYHYFGRTLDLERSYGEEITITPRNFPFAFKHIGIADNCGNSIRPDSPERTEHHEHHERHEHHEHPEATVPGRTEEGESRPDKRNFSNEQNLSDSQNLSDGQTLPDGRNLSEEQNFSDGRNLSDSQNLSDGQNLPNEQTKHYAMIGVALNVDGYPLYYDAANEKGLCAAGLNFVGNTRYGAVTEGKNNVAQFEFIPYLLGHAASVDEARELLRDINIVGTPFSESLPPAELHWLIADGRDSIVVESRSDGLKVFDDPAGVLTNSPPFEAQWTRLGDYTGVSPFPPENRFAVGLTLPVYSRGMGGIGLPGDLSSSSRFVRAAFTALNSFGGESEEENVGRFFHVMDTVAQTKGCCRLESGDCEYTVYTSCCNATTGVYYYTTYDDRSISAVDLHSADLDGTETVRYAMSGGESIRYRTVPVK